MAAIKRLNTFSFLEITLSLIHIYENVIHIKKDGVEYLQFKRLLEYKDKINHVYTLGVDWNFRTATRCV